MTVLTPLPSSTTRLRTFKTMSLQTAVSPAGRIALEPHGRYGPGSAAKAYLAASSGKSRSVRDGWSDSFTGRP
jgi:hypothetical protein